MTAPEEIVGRTASEPGLRWSACILDAANGRQLWAHDADVVLKTASVGKLFLLIETARQAAAGLLDPAGRLTRSGEPVVADSGLWHLLDADELSIGDLCSLIGAVSDNLATNVLLRRIGIQAVSRTSQRLGFRSSALLDVVREERLAEHPVTLSLGCAGELASLLARLHRREIISTEVSDQVLDWLALDTDLSMVAAAFGFDPLAHTDTDRGYLLRHKTGTIFTARIDTGVVLRRSSGGSERAIAYAVLANWDEPSSDQPNPGQPNSEEPNSEEPNSEEIDAEQAKHEGAGWRDLRDDVLSAMRQLGGWIRTQLDESATPSAGSPPG